MSKTYQATSVTRFVNRIMQALLRLSIAPANTYLLTVKGCKSGKPHSTPVTLVEEGSDRWLVAPYGVVGWLRNARVAGQVTLTRGSRSETVSITELGAAESAPVLKWYITRVPITQPYFDVTPTSPLAAFEAEAPRHPVFHLQQQC